MDNLEYTQLLQNKIKWRNAEIKALRLRLNNNAESYREMQKELLKAVDLASRGEKLTTEELKVQFESNGENWEQSSCMGNQYFNGSTQIRWEAWQKCARVNKILKDDEK